MAKRELTNRERKIGKMHPRIVKISEKLIARYKRGILALLKKKRKESRDFTLGDFTRTLKVKEHGRNCELISLFRAIDQLMAEGLTVEYDHPKYQGLHAYKLK